jgi:hypothetical protein
MESISQKETDSMYFGYFQRIFPNGANLQSVVWPTANEHRRRPSAATFGEGPVVPVAPVVPAVGIVPAVPIIRIAKVVPAVRVVGTPPNRGVPPNRKPTYDNHDQNGTIKTGFHFASVISAAEKIRENDPLGISSNFPRMFAGRTNIW